MENIFTKLIKIFTQFFPNHNKLFLEISLEDIK